MFRHATDAYVTAIHTRLFHLLRCVRAGAISIARCTCPSHLPPPMVRSARPNFKLKHNTAFMVGTRTGILVCTAKGGNHRCCRKPLAERRQAPPHASVRQHAPHYSAAPNTLYGRGCLPYRHPNRHLPTRSSDARSATGCKKKHRRHASTNL